MFLFAGCILPIGPEFEDPNGNENHAPAITSSLPANGSFVSISPDSPRSFELTISDQDPADVLYVRWISDFPPATNAVIYDDKQASASPGQLRTLATTVTCVRLSPGMHALTALVADRAFANVGPNREAQLTAVTDNGLKVEAHWFLNLSACPQQ